VTAISVMLGFLGTMGSGYEYVLMWCSIYSSSSTTSPLRPHRRSSHGDVDHRGSVDLRDYHKLYDVLSRGAGFLEIMIPGL
jgi:hypothetical protein